MPFESVLFLALVIGSLAVFAIAVLYADWATRHVTQKNVASVPSKGTAMRPVAHSSASAHKIAA
jgi:hypothetical protein